MPSHYERVIDPQEYSWYEEDRYYLLSYKDESQDSDYDHWEELNQPQKGCQRLKWKDSSYPTCNHFHEFTVEPQESPLQPYDVKYLAHGAFRDSFLLHPMSGEPDFVLKALRLSEKADLDYGWWAGRHIFNEALIMERTSSSPRTIDIYGHCYTSILVEFGYEISQRIVQGVEYSGRGRITQEDLDALQTEDVHPFNDFGPEEKLDIALMMAEGIAVMHGHHEGVIVNDDVHPDQWLVNKDGLIKFNDFNNARVLDFDAEYNEYCKYQVWIGGDYRSPEEMNAEPINEQSDIWPMGANIFALLTGLFPYHDVWDRKSVEKIVASGFKPELDPRYKTRSFIEGRLVDIMEPCFAFDPLERPTIFDVVAHLQETKRIVEERKKLGLIDWDQHRAGLVAEVQDRKPDRKAARLVSWEEMHPDDDNPSKWDDDIPTVLEENSVKEIAKSQDHPMPPSASERTDKGSPGSETDEHDGNKSRWRKAWDRVLDRVPAKSETDLLMQESSTE